MRGRRAIVAVAAGALLLTACKGTPDKTVNAGAPVSMPSRQGDTNLVLRLADGSTLAGRYDPDTLETEIVKLTPDGTVDSAWGTDGRTIVPFEWSIMGSGAWAGSVQADGSVLLYGERDRYTTVVRRLTPTGQLDPTYGDAGTLEVASAWFGTGWPTCALPADGTVVCGTTIETPGGSTGVQLATFDEDGQPTGTRDIAVDFGQFSDGTAPEGTVSTLVGGYLSAIDVEGDDVRVALSVSTAFRNAEGWTIGGSEQDVLVLAIAPTGLDPSFGDGGITHLDIDAYDGGGVGFEFGGWGDWDASVLPQGLDATSDGGTVALVQIYDSHDTGEARHGIVRLDSTGAPDPLYGGDGVEELRDANGTLVSAVAMATRDGADITVVGNVGPYASSQGVVLRLTEEALLDTAFSGDGVAQVPGGNIVTGLDLRNGKVTLGATSYGASMPEGDLLVHVLYG